MAEAHSLTAAFLADHPPEAARVVEVDRVVDLDADDPAHAASPGMGVRA